MTDTATPPGREASDPGAGGKDEQDGVAGRAPKRGPDEAEGRDERLTPEELLRQENRERDIRDENLRRLFADRLDHTASSGAGVIGTQYNLGERGHAQVAAGDFVIYYGPREERPRAIPLTKEEAARYAPAHVVRTESLSLLEKRWEPGRVHVLCGAPGTGRETTALAALVRHARQDATGIAVAIWPPGVDPRQLTEADVDRDTGYLVHATGASPERDTGGALFRRLAHLAERTGSTFVVVADERARFSSQWRDAHVVPHTRPPALAVFERSLAFHLQRLKAADPQELAARIRAHPQVRTELGEDAPPGEAHVLALAVAEAMGEEEDLDEVLLHVAGDLPRRLRERAQKLLRKEESVYVRAFLLAASVLDGTSMVTMTTAALDLAELVDRVDPPPDKSWSAFDERLSDWLEFAETDDDRRAGEAERRLCLRTPRLAGSVLHVAWHEHPALRRPFVAWLHRLVQSDEQEVRIAAAQAVGKLATYDYAEIDREFLQPWIASSGFDRHRLAAWALEAAAWDPRFAPRVGERLNRLARGGPPARSVAVRAYGTSLGGLFLNDALPGLRRIAASGQFAGEVGRAMAELFVSGARQEIVAELARWASSDAVRLRAVAAQTLARLALVPADGADDDCPALLTDRGNEGDTRRMLEVLWRNGLKDPHVGAYVWRLLHDWVHLVDMRPHLLGPVGDLVADLATDAALHRSLGFHLLWWRQAGSLPDTAAKPLLFRLRLRTAQ
ncbi:hypothetical protein [Microbispora sp. H13382]|uniref:hypothetical protein n=1 Tax=Microbispora sp. H13382 TaxID=2729112 RepID=UPI00160132B7|nr:hypothetical protein [Microbispora sp. H13382]